MRSSIELSKLNKELEVSFMDFKDYQDQIIALRRKVYVEEQGFGEFVLTSAKDSTGIHLGAFHQGELISCLAGYIYEPSEKAFKEWELPHCKRCIVQYTRRVENKMYRGIRLNQYMSGFCSKVVYETIRPDYTVIMVMGIHRALQVYYKRTFGFEPYKSFNTPNGEATIMYTPKENQFLHYAKTKKLVSTLSQRYIFTLPSLAFFLLDKMPDLVIIDESVESENLYASPLSLKDELPRLTSQARIVYQEQKDKWDQVDLPTDSGNFLDMGCGPGTYISKLFSHPKLKNYKFTGLDNCAEYITYAKFCQPKVDWTQASVYRTGLPDNHFDIVHVSLVLIHLLNVDLALKEINRILKPGGIFYVLDVNDDTFEGPSVIKRLIQKHQERYIGDRTILNSLPNISTNYQLKVRDQFHTTFDNTGTEDTPFYEASMQNYKMGRNFMWGMFSFTGQVPEVQDLYQQAQKYYFSTKCNISIRMQTQVYVKDN